MIHINQYISIAEDEVHEKFIRASGPGGQKVNKTSSAVQIHFHINHSPSLSDQLKQKLTKLYPNKISRDGFLVITARNHRTQALNRAEAIARLIELIRNAARPKKIRRRTKVPRAAKEKRLKTKHKRSQTKQRRKIDLE